MVAVVTGGGRGIGRGIALGLAEAGWDVAVVARSAEQLAETAELAGRRMLAVPADVADPAAVNAMAREVENNLGPVDLVVNNAAITGPLGPFWESDPVEWWRCQEVNLRGSMLCCRELLPGMIARTAGRIINVVSGAGGRAFSDLSAYVISKTALIRFSEQLALELQPHGISVFPIRPGLVRTAMIEAVRHRLPYIQKLIDDGWIFAAEEVARLVLELASGRADSLSGRLFSVRDDVNAIVRNAEQAQAGELGFLRAREMQGSTFGAAQ